MPLPDIVKTLVACDIAEKGGPQSLFSLPDVLKSTEGERGKCYPKYPPASDERRQIRNVVNDWKRVYKGKDQLQRFLDEVVFPLLKANFTVSEIEHEQTNSNRGKPQASESSDSPRRKRKTNAMEYHNKLGEQIVCPLTNDQIFCCLWVDCETSNMKIRANGNEIKRWKRVPQPESPEELLPHYHWSQDGTNITTSGIKQILEQILPPPNPGPHNERFIPEKWEEDTLLTLNEEVCPYFVDMNGNRTDHVGYHRDNNGFQSITFFLKPLWKSRPNYGKCVNENANPNSNKHIISRTNAPNAGCSTQPQCQQPSSHQPPPQQCQQSPFQQQCQSRQAPFQQQFQQCPPQQHPSQQQQFQQPLPQQQQQCQQAPPPNHPQSSLQPTKPLSFQSPFQQCSFTQHKAPVSEARQQQPLRFPREQQSAPNAQASFHTQGTCHPLTIHATNMLHVQQRHQSEAPASATANAQSPLQQWNPSPQQQPSPPTTLCDGVSSSACGRHSDSSDTTRSAEQLLAFKFANAMSL